jgi:6-methylsalicylic acid synthase
VEAAEQLVRAGARRLLLADARALPPRSRWGTTADPADRHRIEVVLGLEAQGVSVRTVALDLGDPEKAAHAVAAALAEAPQVRGVVFAPEYPEDGAIAGVGPEALKGALAAGEGAVRAAARVFPPERLDFLTVLIPDAHLAEGAGQALHAVYGAAAAAAAADCGAGTVAWNDRVAAAEALGEWARRGLGAAGGALGTAVLPVQRAASVYEAAEADSVDLGALDPQERATLVHEEVAAFIAAEIRMPKEDLDMERPLSNLGLDSVMTLAIRLRLEQRFQLDLPPTLMWRMPTGAAVADNLCELLAPDAAAAVEGV